MEYPFKNLVFEGGGIKGIAYLGALQALEERHILANIKRVGGASAGAINALLLALGMNIDEISKTIWQMDFTKFLDDDWGVIRDSIRLINHYGWYKGDAFKKWISDIIERKTGDPRTTFADIENMKDKGNFKSIYMVGTNLSIADSEIFSAENTPNMPLADAVRISMSLPLFFEAIKKSDGDILVDGGVLNNYPVKLFDRESYVDSIENAIRTDYYDKIKQSDSEVTDMVYNKETLGFRLDSKNEIEMYKEHKKITHKQIDSIFDYSWALLNSIYEFQSNIHLHSDDWNRTVYIDTLGVKTTDFAISDEIKGKLVDSGKAGAETFFTWYDKQ
jgi:NTE family protein